MNGPLMPEERTGPITPEEIAELEWESGWALAEQQLETELAEMQATTQRLNRLARKHGRK